MNGLNLLLVVFWLGSAIITDLHQTAFSKGLNSNPAPATNSESVMHLLWEELVRPTAYA